MSKLVSKLELELEPGWRWNGLKTGTVPLWPSSEKMAPWKHVTKYINQVRNKLSHHYVLCASLHWDSHIHKNVSISINNHAIHSLRPAARCKHLWLWLLLQWMSPEAASNDSFQKRCGMHSQCPNWLKHPGQTICEEQLAWAQGWKESVRWDLVSCRCPFLPFEAKRVTVGRAVAKWRNPMLNLKATQEGWNSSIARSRSDQNEYQSQLATFLEINKTEMMFETNLLLQNS